MASSLDFLSAEEQDLLRATFQAQASELLATVGAGLLRLEAGQGDAALLRTLERAVHTLKGDAATFGLDPLVRVAHRMEDLLLAAAEGACALDGDRVRLLFQATDACERILQGSGEGGAGAGTDLEPLLAALEAPGDRGEDTPHPAESNGGGPEGGEDLALTEYDRLAAAEMEGRGLRPYLLRVQVDPRCQMVGAAAFLLQRHLQAVAEVLRSEPPLDGPVGEGCWAFTLLVGSALDPATLERRLTLPGIVATARVSPLEGSPSAFSPVDGGGGTNGSGAAASEPPPGERPAPPGARNAGFRPPSSAIASTLLVDSRRIDRVMNLVGELVIARSTFFQAFTELQARFPKDELVGRFREAHRLMERSLSDLQKGVMQVRMIPMDRVFRRLPRLVRDLAAASGGTKEVRLDLEGQATELDKTIVDALGEPLGHLIRNAVDHGIEPAAERLQAGKPAAGTLRVTARSEGNQILIEVADDGRGIDPARVRRVAAARGLLAAGAAARLTDTEALDLIFLPRFSTAAHVTASSGRGIGMDAVRAALEDLKGQVQVTSRIGSGTTFTLRVPLTLAIIRGMLFRVAGRLFALPLSTIAEITRIDAAAVRSVDGHEALPLRDRVLSLLRLDEALGLAPIAEGGRRKAESEGPNPQSTIHNPRSERRLYVLVVALADRRIGLVVDGLQGETELVIKALATDWVSRAPIAGGAILGDGRVVLILDPGALVRQALARAQGAAPSPAGEPAAAGTPHGAGRRRHGAGS